MNYYIFRHGETFATKGNVEYGKHVIDAPTLREGIPTTKRMAEYLKEINTNFNVRSEFLRVAQTAAIITDITGRRFETDARLNDTLVAPKEYETMYPKTETREEFIARVTSFVDDLKSKPYDTVLIGTHGGVIAALKHLLVNGEFDYKNIMDFPRPGVLTIIKGNTIEEIDFNSAGIEQTQ